jgi:hypothetical protein
LVFDRSMQQHQIGDIVAYKFKSIPKHIEIAKIIAKIEPSNYIVEFIIYNKYRNDTNIIIQDIYNIYLSSCVLNNYMHLTNNPSYSINNKYFNLINNTIPINLESIIESRSVPKDSMDIITYEEINDGDILVDFLRDDKTEYEHNTFYKESTLKYIMESKKNQFTMKPIDIATIVKYKAHIE